MKIEIFDTGLFIDMNHLKEIKSPILFQRGNVPDPDGLISNEIFGLDVKRRRQTFAYIDLKAHFFNPHIYKALKRLYRNIDKIINGMEYYSINKDGILVKDPAGETGLDFLYDNWEKINWERSENTTSMRNERIDIVTKSKKSEVFMQYQIVIPAFYRDIQLDSSGGGENDPLNNLYAKQLRLASMLSDKDMFDFTYHSTNYSMQGLIEEIYDYFKVKLQKKNGMIRKFLMGKNIDFCTRSVITSPNFHANRPEEMEIQFDRSGIPISQVCSLCYPFIVTWIRNFFEREFIMNQASKILFNQATGEVEEIVEIYKPEMYFTDEFIKRMIDRYISDPETRFDPILIPIGKDKYMHMAFTGKRIDSSTTSDLSTISNRSFTVTDLLYMACYDVAKDKHAVVTRYPVSDSYGLFISQIHVLSTLETEPVRVNDTVYQFYPKIEPNLSKSKIAIRFIETLKFSNAYLKGLNGDYDGDQVTVKILWTHEANAECFDVINSKNFYITPAGKMIRPVGNEASQTFYALTKNPGKHNRKIVNTEKEFLLNLTPDDITFDLLIDLFADRRNGDKVKQSKFKPNDIMVLEKRDYFNKSDIETTVGRFILNKFLIEKLGFIEVTGYVNEELTSSSYDKCIESLITIALREDKITTNQMKEYVDYRDWLGFQCNALITTSFTPDVLKIPKEVKALKSELLKKYKTELENGDQRIAEEIEKTLVAKTMEVLKDDNGLDVFVSGARGSVKNNLKNIILMRGATLNPNTGKYDIVTTSLMDGMEKKDIPSSGNAIVMGAYPKAVGTADSGYLSKQLLSGMQTEILDEAGTDCGTDKTITMILEKGDVSEYTYRNINDNGKVVLLTPSSINKYLGKKINVYSPLFCCGDKICNKCAGKQFTKFIGLETSKIATTLTNLNMKKFHDNTIKNVKFDMKDLLMENKRTGIFVSDGRNVVLKDSYCEFYIPMSYFDKKYSFAEELGDMINVLGLFNVGIFKNGKLEYIDTFNIPSWVKIHQYEYEIRNVDLPSEGSTPCHVMKFYKDSIICDDSIVEDSVNAQVMLKCINYGKLPKTIPYSKSIHIWRKNQKMNGVNFGVPAIILEIVLSVAYRDKNNLGYKFAKIYGPKDSKVSEYDYEMASIRKICQYASTFSGITFEDIDSMITTSVNRARDKKPEADTPVEMLFKL